jgi:hypothetical protein
LATKESRTIFIHSFAGAHAMYLPLAAARGTIGVLGVRPPAADRTWPPKQRHLLNRKPA